ncbi:PLP-dependent aminotransferase family protein [Pseudoalteromonas sp. NZS127]|uniref:aminotransferase-like domain-containing protein n=1 Tax=unclassified Pseudoalteromonas TaxID=194690 RepID=UPI0015FB263A|nr:PLP-dependent aminotransferase family protein [Pseudoalteromonas sp. SR45-4]MBB1370810.1 PLP-dependent aminotransferase family protein [Pseudoalteromonas sp. SR45-4]MBH0073111.1 PLP-dependent aminotransferase family protein [Pseudoalteromonas sp. NZS127]
MLKAVSHQGHEFLYQQVIQLIRDMSAQQALLPSEKLPSLRKMASNLNISIPTVKQAYQALEDQGVIEAREKSGYFLKAVNMASSLPKRVKLSREPVIVNKQALIEQVYTAIHQAHVVPFGVANPVAAAPTDKALARNMRRVMTLAGSSAINYGPLDGYAPLKKQLIHRYLDFGIGINMDEMVITNGAQEALAIALKCVTKPGDVVAIESPCYHGIIELIESLGLKALEIPLCPDNGIWLNDLAQALNEHDIKACLFSTAISNPVGSFMPDENREQLVELVESHNVVLIEDDVYGDLYFTPKRGTPAIAYSKKGLVLSCSSFSKTAAPSYRVGWLIAGKFAGQARRYKRALSCSTSLINQWTLSEFVFSGEYDRNLKVLRQRLRTNKEHMRRCLQQAMPKGTRISDPQGGCVIWLDLGSEYDSQKLFLLALEVGISITPGLIFSASNKYKSCIRLSYGVQWSEQIEQAIVTLGKLTLLAKKVA